MAFFDYAASIPAGEFDHPLPQALMELNASQAQTLAVGILASWPRALSGLMAEAYNQVESDAAQELKRCTLEQPARLSQRLEQEVLWRLNPTRRNARAKLIDFRRLSLTPEEEDEEQAALLSLANTFDLASGRAGLQARMQLALTARRLGLPGLAEAASGRAPVAAFLFTLRILGVGLQARILALRAFETLALPVWTQWQAEVAELCARQAMAAPDAAAEPGETAGLSAAAKTSFKTAANAAEGGNDARFASELLGIDRSGHALRPALLAFNQWFDALKAEPQFPAAFHLEWEAMRLSLCKVALSDDHFFTAVEHVVRSEASKICLRAALTQPGLVSAAQVRANLRALVAGAQALTQTDLLALLRQKTPPHESELATFFTHAEIEAKARHDDLLNTVRHAALERGGERRLPASALPVFTAGLAPLLVTAWLRDGCGSASERDALALLQRFQQCRATGKGSLQLTQLRDELQRAWAEKGVDALWIESLSRQLEQAWQDGSAHAALGGSKTEDEIAALLNALEAPAPAADERLTVLPPALAARVDATAQLFAKGRWLRIASGENGGARFLCVGHFDPGQKVVWLNTATGETAMQCAAEGLLAELFSGTAQLLNPSAETSTLLEALRPAAV